MRNRRNLRLLLPALAVGWALLSPPPARAACCYFSAKDQDILQPAQKAFITWDPQKQEESFTVQPKFEGNALDFGMVIPTPSRPKLHEMPRDFFKHLAVYTIMKRRESPSSRLLLEEERRNFRDKSKGEAKKDDDRPPIPKKRSPVEILEEGILGSLDYKIISAERADDLYGWLKDNKYHYAGDEATLNFYVQKK